MLSIRAIANVLNLFWSFTPDWLLHSLPFLVSNPVFWGLYNGSHQELALWPLFPLLSGSHGFQQLCPSVCQLPNTGKPNCLFLFVITASRCMVVVIMYILCVHRCWGSPANQSQVCLISYFYFFLRCTNLLLSLSLPPSPPSPLPTITNTTWHNCLTHFSDQPSGLRDLSCLLIIRHTIKKKCSIWKNIF